MNGLLDEACAILDDFEHEMTGIKTFYEQTATNNLHFEPVSPESWQERHYRMWLHGETDVWRGNELARWLIDDLPSTAIANSPAKAVYAAWRKWLLVAGPVKVDMVLDYDKKSRTHVERESRKPSEAFYVDNGRFEIQEPLQGETLLDFIVRLARSLEEAYEKQKKRERKERKLGDWLEERALKSFLDFIRKQYPIEQVTFVEHIFPQKMDLHYGRIIRLISPEAHPIPEKTAAEILIELARRCRIGYPVARHTAVESLALSWLCIACSRIRLPKALEIVRSIQPEAVLFGAEFGVSKNRTFGHKEFWRPLTDADFSVLRVPTWFGGQPLKISNRIAAFLKIVARLPSKKARTTIFQKSRKSLDQMFNLALQTVAPDPEYGKITYLSLLKEDPGRDRILTDEEIARLLDACKTSKSPYLYCIVFFALTTGARRGEILGLEWRHIDFDNRLAYLKETKNGRPRSVALADPVVDELKKLYEHRQPNKHLVFSSKTAFGRIDIKKAWQEALRRTGISDYHFHDTRHQFATLAARLGASNLELATAMGHRTLEMLQRYTHLDAQITKRFSKGITDQIINKR